MAQGRSRQEGQAALVAVVGLVILAIGMYTSYNLSRAVYEKIELQNAADATAYSLATLEARTFNFIAFANRAQVANYVQMMESQSLLSYMTAVEAATGYFGDLVQCVEKAAGNSAGSLVGVGAGLAALHETTIPIIDLMDEFVPKYIEVQTTKNWALLIVSGMYVLTTSLQLADGGMDIAKANDPDAQNPLAIQVALGVLNNASYLNAIDLNGIGLHANSSEASKRIMTEIANASRYNGTLDAHPDFTVSRGVFDILSSAIGGLGGVSGGGARLGAVIDKVSALINLSHVGTSKLMQVEGGTVADLEQTGESQAEKSDLAMADAIVAKDTWFFPEGFLSVQSGVNESLHCRYVKPTRPDLSGTRYGCAGALPGNAGRVQALVRAGLLIADMPGHGFAKKNCKREGEDDHRWGAFVLPGGMTPYFTFASGLSGIEAEKTSFNQPDVWVMLNKPPAAMALGGPGDLEFNLKQGRYSAELDARIGEGGLLDSGVLRGMNAIARAQVYYHRPGAWQEPPNFFNPYWGARLAPTNVPIKRLAAAVGLSGIFGQIIADNVCMH
jgi:hypothetical protein